MKELQQTMMGENVSENVEKVTAEEARQVSWWKRNKAERRAIFEQREGKRKATLERRLPPEDLAERKVGFAARHQFDSSFGGYSLKGAKIGKGVLSVRPVAGAVAEFEHGANLGSRVTATRVVLVGVLALALKKNKNKVYVVIELPNGEQMLAEGPAKEERQARQFAAKVNQAGRFWAEHTDPPEPDAT